MLMNITSEPYSTHLKVYVLVPVYNIGFRDKCTVSFQMLVIFLDEMSAYAQPMHLIFGTVKDIASVFQRIKNQRA